jgi:hypothetical protein
MGTQPRAGGTTDLEFDLVSVIYHSLQGMQAAGVYADDAVATGDDELAGFFQAMQQESRQRAEHAKQLLGQRLPQAGATKG